jgi:fucose permease
MAAILLAIIYLCFISLGLPDTFIGACWPAISSTFEVSESMQGISTMVVSICTIFSAFLTSPIERKFKTHTIVVVSICLTVTGLVGIMFSPNIFIFIISMIPLGLGAGSIDAVLNNYVAINYKAHHLHFLHSCWSLGALLSPIVASLFLVDTKGWRNALFVLAITQAIILLISLFSKPLWKDAELVREENKSDIKLTFFETFKIRGAHAIILAFFFIMGAEMLMMNWFTSMLVFAREINQDTAARWTSYIFIGYTVSRIFSGLLSKWISDKNIIRIFTVTYIIAVILLMFIKYPPFIPFIAFLLGFGMGPIYPAIVHDTPNKFGVNLSGNVMSIQVGCAYIAMISISPLFGLIAEHTSFELLPYFILGCTLIMFVLSEIANTLTKDKSLLLKHIKNR